MIQQIRIYGILLVSNTIIVYYYLFFIFFHCFILSFFPFFLIFAAMEEKEQQRLIRRYYQYLKLEKGSSPNTIDAYMRDLDKFLRFIKDEGKDFLSIELQDIHHFSALMMDVGIHAVSLSRTGVERCAGSEPYRIAGVSEETAASS